MYRKLITMLAIVLLSACSTEDAEVKEEIVSEEVIVEDKLAYNVNAVFFKGLVSGATCDLYSVIEGIQSNLLLSERTNENGRVSFEEINYSGTALIECTKGIYRDEATERTINNTIPKIRTVINIAGSEDTTLEYVLSPLTEIATSIAEFNNENLNEVISTYNQKVAKAFGLSGNIDISKTIPLDLLENVISEDRDDAAYAFSIALIAGVTLNQDETRTLSEIINDLSVDLNEEFKKDNETFSDLKKSELGESASFYLTFGSLVNSSLQATQIRQNIVELAGLVLVEAGKIVTDSLKDPIDLIRTELADYILEANLERVPAAPFVSNEMYELGQALAFDKILSGNKDTSCLSCHHPLLATGDARSLPLGTGGVNLGQERVGGEVVPRHAPTLFNLDLFKNMFWDGRVEFNEEQKLSTPADSTGDITAEMEKVFFSEQEKDGFQGYGLVSAQAMFPVTSTEEMRGEHLDGNELAQYSAEDFKEIWEALMIRLSGIPEYVTMFELAYPNVQFEDMTFSHAANAIAGFEVKAFNLRDTPWQEVIEDVASDGI